MSIKQNVFDKNSANHQVESLLQGIKQKAGDVIQIAITKRTTIELPASLTQEERDARVASYIKLHKSMI